MSSSAIKKAFSVKIGIVAVVLAGVAVFVQPMAAQDESLNLAPKSIRRASCCT